MTLLNPVQQRLKSLSGFQLWLIFSGVLLLIGISAAIQVLYFGLQVTNLTDPVPWGLWITVDLSAIALGAGAFSLSTIAYIFRVRSFQRIARIAVFVGFVGYTSAMLALIMDIGRPERFWHPLIFWNVHSVLWEITMCVVFYSMVLVFELAPAVLESSVVTRRFRRGPQLAHLLHHGTPVVSIVGLGLSLLHQSSLGATYGILSAHPIWYKPSLPLMFILSAVAAGASVTLGVTVFYENLVHVRQISTHLRRRIATFAGLMMLGYLYLKMWDFLATSYYSHLPARSEANDVLKNATPYGVTFWWMEVILGALIPALILLTPRLRRRDIWIIVAALLAMGGIIVNRWNVTLSGLVVPVDWSPGIANVFPVREYMPTAIEWGIALGVVGYALLMLTLGLRYLPFFPRTNRTPESSEVKPA